MAGSTVNQTHAQAAGDVVGRDKHVNAPISPLQRLMDALADEIRKDETIQGRIDNLQYYYDNDTYDDVIGLEAKLFTSGRGKDYRTALKKKELFVKLMTEYSLYKSAQKIFSYLLARIDKKFIYKIEPQIDNLTNAELDELIYDLIIEEIGKEVAVGVVAIDENIIEGMIYWLAEQCYFRWHK